MRRSFLRRARGLPHCEGDGDKLQIPRPLASLGLGMTRSEERGETEVCFPFSVQIEDVLSFNCQAEVCTLVPDRSQCSGLK